MEEPQFYANGCWIVAVFHVKTKKNCYLGQILDILENEEALFQFYRCQVPYDQIYVKLSEEETHEQSCIMKSVPKDVIEIISGDKIKLLQDVGVKLV